MNNYWLICDKNKCLYAEQGLRRMRAPRCIKHGAILTYENRWNGLSRSDAAKALKARLEKGAK